MAKSTKSRPLVDDNDPLVRISDLERNLQQFLDFMRSLPPGWLGKTTGDIGLLNAAYCEARRLGMKV